MSRLLVSFSVIGLLLFSCNTGQSNSAANTDSTKPQGNAMAPASGMLEKNRATAMASIMAFNAHDVNAVYKDAAPGCVDYWDGTVPPIKGVDSCKAAMAAFLAAFPDMKGDNLSSMADGDRVVVFGNWAGTFKAPYMGMKPSNKVMRTYEANIFTFNDKGQIIKHLSVVTNLSENDQQGVK